MDLFVLIFDFDALAEQQQRQQHQQQQPHPQLLQHLRHNNNNSPDEAKKFLYRFCLKVEILTPEM